MMMRGMGRGVRVIDPGSTMSAMLEGLLVVVERGLDVVCLHSVGVFYGRGKREDVDEPTMSLQSREEGVLDLNEPNESLKCRRYIHGEDIQYPRTHGLSNSL